MQKIEKITFKVVQIKFLAMHITNQIKLKYLRYKISMQRPISKHYHRNNFEVLSGVIIRLGFIGNTLK